MFAFTLANNSSLVAVSPAMRLRYDHSQSILQLSPNIRNQLTELSHLFISSSVQFSGSPLGSA